MTPWERENHCPTKGNDPINHSTSTTKKYAAIYVRVSTEEQAEHGYSLKTQLDACRTLAQREGDTVLESHIFVEDYTGTTLTRPALSKLRALVQSQQINKLIVSDMDRLSRTLAQQLLLRGELAQANVQLRVVSMPALTNATEGDLIANVWGSFAEYERGKILERTKRGLIGRAQAGLPSGSKIPFGYRYVKQDPEPGKPPQVTFIIHAEEADIVRRIFRLYVHDGLSLYAIAKQLTEARIPTHRDRRSTGPQRRLTPGTWNPATIFVMLTNKTYIGTYYWNKTESLSGRSNPDKKTRRRLRPKEEWIAIAVPPIIDPETFAAVSSQRHHNARTSRRNSHYEYLLGQGRLHCDVCGCSMAGHCDTRRGAVRSYHCSKPQLC